MALLNILQYPDARLHIVAKPVAEVDQRIDTLVSDMFETMYEAHGIGLAATQVNVHVQVIVIDLAQTQDSPLVLINPKTIELMGTCESEEGCLSVAGVYEVVSRAERVRVAALDRQGVPCVIEADGLLAICIQHEMDHLIGRVFVDHLSAIKRARITKKLQKMRRQTL